MKRSMALISVIMILAGGLAQAAVQKGDREISLGGYYQKFAGNTKNGVSGPDITNASIHGGYGYFVTDNIQVTGILGYSSFRSEPKTGSATGYYYLDMGAQARYHFRIDEPLVPYVGVELLYNQGLDTGKAFVAGDKGSGTQMGIGGGFRYELSPKSDFYLELWYKKLGGDWEDATANGGVGVDSMTHMRFGLIHKFN